MHANTALPCAWALGTLLVLTGCASRGPSTTHPLDLPAPPCVADGTRPDAVRAPSPPSVLVLRPGHPEGVDRRAVPLGRDERVQPALSVPTPRDETLPAPCALQPEPTGRPAALRPGVRVRSRTPGRRQARLAVEPASCAGGT